MNNMFSDGNGTEKKKKSLIPGFLPDYLGNNALLPK